MKSFGIFNMKDIRSGKLASNRNNLLLIFVFVFCLVYTKWIIIHYGLPYTTHVDETTILRDPFKNIIEYGQGDFSRPTNLFNWIFIGYSGFVFIVGLITGAWSGLEDFKLFLISGSGDVLLIGRLLSLIVSTIGSIILLRLIFKITDLFHLRVIFSLIVLFNPIEWNSTNWIKFDPYSYLLYAMILNVAYDYFVLEKDKSRSWLFLVVSIGVALRIEIIAYLIGFFIYDFFFHRSNEQFLSKVKFYTITLGLGALLYSAITFLPLTILFNTFHQVPVAKDLTMSPTFEEAIATKIPGYASLLQSVFNSKFYLTAILALMGPLVPLFFILNIKNRSTRFIYAPFLVTVVVLLIFPIKEVHYLLNVSILLVVGALLYLNKLADQRRVVILAVLSLIWTISYCLNFLVIINHGDVRLSAREYLLEKTKPNDVILIEGIFADIYDSPARNMLRSEAARFIGSTGLSSEYLSRHTKVDETRQIIEVSTYQPFKDTPYEDIFSISYDTVAVKRAHPKYFVYAARSSQHLAFQRHVSYATHSSFFSFIERNASLEASFLYPDADRRLLYSNFYYFHPVLVYKFRTDF